MDIAIIISTKDKAGLNIKRNLISHFGFIESREDFEDHKIYHNDEEDVSLFTTDIETPYTEELDKKIKADLLIYATKHSSVSGIPSLSVHCTGNWGKAQMGGKDKALCISPQNFLKESIRFMEREHRKYEKIRDFDVIQECTHHGPFLETPIMFIEIGSLEQQWEIPEAGYFIAETIMFLLKNRKSIRDKRYDVAVGIGGTHTLSNFKKIIMDEKTAISHVCPKYMLSELTKDLVEKAAGCSMKKADLVILDWKGLGREKEKVKQICEELELPVKRTKDF